VNKPSVGKRQRNRNNEEVNKTNCTKDLNEERREKERQQSTNFNDCQELGVANVDEANTSFNCDFHSTKRGNINLRPNKRQKYSNIAR